MLGSYRVLDLTDERGQLAGAILAQLGAEVILVEPPGGSSSRRVGPFAADRPGAERSLSHWAHNRGKLSIVLDWADAQQDRASLEELARDADVFIESGAPGELSALGLGYERLRELNPALVYVSITPFGQDGPRAGWAATELTVWASSGALVLTGDDDRPPVRVSLPQAFLHAGADGANGALLALLERARSGLGQHVDVSAQQSALQATQSMVLAAALRSTELSRMAGGVRVGPLEVQTAWPCKDGHVSITFLFGVAIGPYTRRLMEWICEEGFCDEATRDKNWTDYAILLLTQQEPLEEYDRVKRVVESFTRTRTKAELLQAALERRLLIAPVSTIGDVVQSEHLSARDYWDHVDDELLSAGGVKAPGAFAKASATPLPRLGRAPRVGEHSVTIRPRPRYPDRVLETAARALPLEGVKVLDLMWVMAGPAITRVMADFGATVVRVESATRIETSRTINPFVDNVPDPEHSGLFLNMNAGKLGCAINMEKPESRGLIEDLVRWADVVTESFSPKAMRAWGLSYERLREVNPSIVMLSSCLMGQSGPLAEFAGFGNLAAAIAGFFNITGWPDRAPAGPFGAYTDYVSPRYGLAVLLAALDHRRRTGEGQYIDLSQAEAAMHFLTPAILDYTVNGRVFERYGNADPHMAPHGVYASEGEDAWVAIACADDRQWRSLCELIGRSDLAADHSLDTAEARIARAAELDKVVEEWTRSRPSHDAAERCQAAGLPAYAVQTSAGCVADPQLVDRGHFVEVEHSVLGPVTVEGSRIRLSRTPALVERAAPALGQDTSDVLRDILAYDAERIGDLYAAEVLE